MQFDRFIELLIGPTGSEEGLGIRNLRVVFDVNKTTKNTTNKATVSLYNLSKFSYNKFSDSVSKNLLILKAGYVSTAEDDTVVFEGDISKISRPQEGADIITKFECSDGSKAITDIRKALSYKEGISAKKILEDIVKLFPLANKSAVEIPDVEDVQYTNAFSDIGRLADILDKVTNTLALEWSIQNNELKIIRAGGNDGTRAVKLTPSTGMIGSPERINDINLGGQVLKGVAGWKVTSLLQPRIEPNGIISMESKEIEAGSQFKVISVQHKGDTHSNNWFSITEVIGA